MTTHRWIAGALLIVLAGVAVGCHAGPGTPRRDASEGRSEVARATGTRRALDFPRLYPGEHAALQATERALARVPLEYARKGPPGADGAGVTGATESRGGAGDAGSAGVTGATESRDGAGGAGGFRPAGMYFEPHGQTLWVWSQAHPGQRGFALRDGRWQPAGTRTGPLDTRRCVALTREPLTLCVGLLQPGGVRAFGAASPATGAAPGSTPGSTSGAAPGSAPGAGFASGLPARGGFPDLAVSEVHGRVYVIDAYGDELWILDTRGAVQGRVPLVPGAHAVGMLGDDALFVLAANQPRLSILALDQHGLPAPAPAAAIGMTSPTAPAPAPAAAIGMTPPTVPAPTSPTAPAMTSPPAPAPTSAPAPAAAIGIDTPAPIRAARHDAQRGLLWTAGHRQARVRRHRGYIENLESFVYAYRQADLLRGRFVPVHAVDLAAAHLTDPVAVVPAGTQVLAALAGSHRLVGIDIGPPAPAPAGAPGGVRAQPSAFVTSDVLAVGDQVLTVGLLDDRVYVHRGDDLGLVETLPLADRAHGPLTDYALGEVLFHSKSLWADTPRNQFTCASCHWDGLSDRRMHPGYAERRWEMIRPAAGAGMLSPIFTPGQASDLTVAVHGFVRALDERYWTDPGAGAWLDAIDVEIAPGQRTRLSAYEVRRALVTYLARRPVEPGFLRAPGQPFSEAALRGAALFWRDCAGCHQPSPHLATGPVLAREAALDYLVERPLAFGAARHEKAGVLPYFTPRGNRVSPLTQLGRGGPFFSNGSARTLADVLRRTHPSPSLVPGHPGVHAPGNALAPFYDRAETQELIDFLLSI
jgi:hypothetical protein